MSSQPPIPLFCAECGDIFHPKREHQVYCSLACNQRHHRRRLLGGLKLYDAAMKWRIERPCGALGDLTFIADELAHIERGLRDTRRARINELQRDKRA